jgi:hypothetical protein
MPVKAIGKSWRRIFAPSAIWRSVLDPIWKMEVVPEAASLLPPMAGKFKSYSGFKFALLGRMLFSCLVDADFKDTEAFYNEREGRNCRWKTFVRGLSSVTCKAISCKFHPKHH